MRTEDVLHEKLPSGKTVKEEIDQLISLVGENITFRRAKKVMVSHGIISSYIHSAVNPNMGKIGVLVAIEADGSFCSEKLGDLGKKIAMHIAAANPIYICSKCVAPAILEKEKEIARAKAKETGKPDEIAEKIAEGCVKKYLEENALSDQIFVIDGKSKVREVIEKFCKDNGIVIRIPEFTKFVLGEGIEKKETNFAEEVASFMK